MIVGSTEQITELRSKMIAVIEKMTELIANGGSVSSDAYRALKTQKKELNNRIDELQKRTLTPA